MSRVYERLVELARREAEAIDGGAWGDLVRLADERDALIAAMPASPPADGLGALADAERLTRANGTRLAAAIEAARGDLDHVARGRRALGAYGRRDERPGIQARA